MHRSRRQPNAEMDLPYGERPCPVLPSCFPPRAPYLGHRASPALQSEPHGSTVKLVIGGGFTGQGFERRTGFSVKGRFTFKPPAQVDRTVDLEDSFLVRPFGEAHNHNLGSGAEESERAAVARYLADGSTSKFRVARR